MDIYGLPLCCFSCYPPPPPTLSNSLREQFKSQESKEGEVLLRWGLHRGPAAVSRSLLIALAVGFHDTSQQQSGRAVISAPYLVVSEILCGQSACLSLFFFSSSEDKPHSSFCSSGVSFVLVFSLSSTSFWLGRKSPTAFAWSWTAADVLLTDEPMLLIVTNVLIDGKNRLYLFRTPFATFDNSTQPTLHPGVSIENIVVLPIWPDLRISHSGAVSFSDMEQLWMSTKWSKYRKCTKYSAEIQIYPI